MSADRLRQAAQVLRERAEGAPPAPWTSHDGWAGVTYGPPDEPGGYIAGPYSGDHGRRTRDYIAIMHPGVGLALADWLDDHAPVGESWSRRGGVPYTYDPAALRVADLIIEGEQS